jgi:hypothetical protein
VTGVADVRNHLRYVSDLVDAKSTLAQKRRLVVGGWLSLLAATLYTDLARKRATAARRNRSVGSRRR